MWRIFNYFYGIFKDDFIKKRHFSAHIPKNTCVKMHFFDNVLSIMIIFDNSKYQNISFILSIGAFFLNPHFSTIEYKF